MSRAKKEHTNRLYFSKRLTAMLKGMLTARTTIISSPAGYGKTTAAREYLNKNLSKTAALYWLTFVEEPAFAAWERFCRAIQKIDAKTGSGLLALGLPDEDTKGKIATLFMKMECQKETLLVMDDFQDIKSKVPDTVWNALIEHGAQNLHIVILTWTTVEARVTLKPGVLYLERDDLRLKESEIGEYFAQEGVTLTSEQLRWLNRHTEGWIIALNLQKKNYLNTGSFLHTSDIHRLIREIVWNKLTDGERDFLLCVSPFDSYTFRQAAHMTGAAELAGYAKTLSKNNNFIHSDPRGLLFRPHSALLDFVRGLFNEISENEQRDILTRAGEWCAGNKQPEQAMYFYHRLGDYGKILSLDFFGMEFEQSDRTDYADILLNLLENTTPAEKLAHSISVIKIIFILFGAGRYEEFGRWCGQMSALASGHKLPEAEKTRLFGELALLTSFIKYNNISEMGGLIRRAHEMLDGRPSLIRMTDAWTFGNASVLFMYHSETGRLDTELADMDENCAHYFALTKGHGSGGNVLMRAEAHFNRNEMDDAAILAHKALYQAKNKRQECVCIGAMLLLGRLAVYRGDAEEFASILEWRISRYAEQNPLKSNRMEADLTASFLMMLLDRPEDAAEWLRRGDISERRLLAVSIPFAQILFGKYLLQSGKPEVWLGMESDAMELADVLRCRMAMIYGGILTAAAWQAQGKMPKAAAALQTAFDLALPDRVYMPFAENSSLLGATLDAHCPTAALKEIAALTEAQEAGKAAIVRKLYPSLPFGLTEREYEVAKLVAQNLTSPEIAKKLFISLNTVKTHIKNIYQKTQISSRSDLRGMFAQN